MPEDMNLEVAHKLTEREEPVRGSRRWEEVIEILGVLLLAVAAVATAWGGFQAAKGDGRQSILYAEAGVDRVQATTVAIAGQQGWRLMHPRSTNGWRQRAPTMRSFRRCWCAGSARNTGRRSTPG
jgi:hypothetical protein